MDGGAYVVLSGTNFTGATGVIFGGTAASFTVNSATQITATTPAHAVGVVNVAVTTPGGTATLANGYTFIAPPDASSFTYGSIVAYNDGGNVPTLLDLSVATTGSTTVYGVGNTTTAQGGSVSVNATGQATYTPPVGFRGANDSFTWTAANAAGTSARATATVMIGSPSYFVTLPAYTGAAGQAYNVGAQPVHMEGGMPPYSGFSATGLPAGLSMSASGVISGTPTQAGSFNVSVQATDSSTGAGAYTGSAQATLTIASGGPTVTSIYPSQGPVAGGATIYLAGTNFTGVTAAYFGSTPATIVAVDSATSMRVIAPAGTPGSVNVTVHNPYGVSAVASANLYTYIATPAPPTIVSGPPLVTNSTSATFTVNPAPGTTLIAQRGAGAFVEVTSPITYTGFAEGTYTVAFRSSDRGVSSQSTIYTWTVDTTAPSAPVVTAPANGSTTTNPSPAVTGMAEANSTVTVLIDNSWIGATTANASGAWSFTLPVALGVGAHTVTATATDAAGNVSPASAANVFTIQSTAPTASNRSGVAVAYDSPGQAIDLSASISGVYGSISVATAPAHGTVGVSGSVVTYTPAPGYYGADSFTYTATGPGGTSSAATVSLTVATPSAPTASNRSGVAVAYDSPGQAIDLSASISGVYGSISVATAPAHGTVGVSGSVVTYTPAPGYYGADSFTYTATGPGGTSSAATVSLTVATPSAPTASNRSGVAVAYDSSGQAIDLSASISGVYGSISVATAPAHGTVGVSGSVVTYTPAPGYYGADSFTYTATGPGGTSSAATVSLTVATPSAPTASNRSGVAVAYDSPGQAIDLSASISGVYGSISVATAPAHGTVGVSGSVVTYTPAPGYYGADSFTYTATGPGGTSSAATVSLTVATPSAPTASNRSGVAVAYDSPGQAIDLSASISGVYGSISVATAPAHGTVGVSGSVVTYTPAPGYYGADSFTYTATGPGGTSSAATVSLTVATPSAPTASNRSGVAVAYDSSGQAIDLSASISGVYGSISVATAPAHGTVGVSGSVVTYTPAPGYYGADSFTYTATGPGGTSSAATVSLTVATPSAPTASNRSGVAVAYDSPGQAIDLSASISGVYGSISVATAPAHGTVGVSGSVVTYTPAPGYYGADSFTYTATGPGGTSSAATVSLTVATPSAPTASNRSGVAVAYDSSGQAIDLSASISGVYGSISVATAPAHGTVGVSGSVVTYTPAPGYYGADSFTYTATGPGGTSSAATVSLTVATPSAPTASNRSGVAVAYDSSGQAIDLSASISGVYGSISVATAPAHGTVGVSGSVVTYTPAPGYYGADSFTYTATGPGGTSSAATVSLTVATPAPPAVTPPAAIIVPPASGGDTAPISVDLGARTQGVTDGYRITVDARFGSGVIRSSSATTTSQSVGSSAAGSQATETFLLVYTPAANFIGTDTVTVVAFGPGGDSAPATFTFQVAGKAPDLSNSIASSATLTVSPTATLVGGPFQALRITRQPTFGAATVQGLNIVFTPGVANGGSTSLDYVIDLPFGSSAAGRLDLTVGQVPASQALVADTVQGHPVTVRISNAAGGPFTGAAVASISPTSAGSAAITGTGGIYDLTFTPQGTFSGQAVISFTLTNANGTSTGTLTVTVAARPDPSLDPDVRGVASAQVTAARRFSDAQVDNFQRRLEGLRDGSNESRNGLSLNVGGVGGQDDRDPRVALRRQLGQDQRLDPGALGDDRDRDMLGLNFGSDRAPPAEPAARPGGQLNAASAGQGATQGGGPVGVWTSGSVDWGRQDAKGLRDSRFTTQGVTAGLDIRLNDTLIVGGGLGYSEDKTRIGDNGSTSRGKATTGALYASWRPAEGWFVDGVVGLSRLDFDTRRWVVGLLGQTNGYAEGERSGDVRFASASVGRTLRRQGLAADLYVRMEGRDIALDAFTETSGGLSALTWDALDQSGLSVNLGASWRWTIESRRFGVLRPTARLEWSHELEDIETQGIRYADWAASPTYLVPLDGWSRDALNLDLGAEWSLSDRLMLSLGYRGMLGDASTSHGGMVGLKYGW
ncbi:hypothetical protein QE389_000613 [Brevundimonas sp. SORGH_AS 993]|nr:hypothetical protein [Brevundimonas sp. SORGH_AS_0993]